MLNIHAESVAELVRTVENGRKFCIVGHTSPDGDAVGACVAMREFLRSLGKEAVIVLPNRFPAFLRHLDPEGTILLYDADKERAGRAISGSQVLFCLDFNSFSRTDEMADALEASKARKILIDHHIGPDVRSFDLTLSMTDISSTCELLYHILKMFPNVGGNASLLPPLTAEALFTGMTTDTNNFANSVYPSTFSMASELLAAGIDRTTMLCRLYNQFSEGRLRLIGELLRNRMKILDGKFSYMMLPLGLQHEYGYSKGDVEGVQAADRYGDSVGQHAGGASCGGAGGDGACGRKSKDSRSGEEGRGKPCVGGGGSGSGVGEARRGKFRGR